jgi:serine/threonine protein kinase
MGVVYAAHDRVLNRAVAIKMIREAGADAAARARLLREARACASVNHPNVCQVYEVGEEDDQVFIVMERLQGESLASRVRRGPLPLSEAVSVTLAILAALEALHQRGLVHRDLKPSNVFLTPHGVKLPDFGLARPMQSAVTDTRTAVTSSGFAAGTPQYMAPEQFVDPSADARADVFAAAATLFEMLAGKPAFAGPTLVQVMHAVLYTHPPALAGSGCRVPRLQPAGCRERLALRSGVADRALDAGRRALRHRRRRLHPHRRGSRRRHRPDRNRAARGRPAPRHQSAGRGAGRHGDLVATLPGAAG